MVSTFHSDTTVNFKASQQQMVSFWMNVLLFWVAAVMWRGEGNGCRDQFMAWLGNMEVNAAFEEEWRSRLLTLVATWSFLTCYFSVNWTSHCISHCRRHNGSRASRRIEPETGNFLFFVRKNKKPHWWAFVQPTQTQQQFSVTNRGQKRRRGEN